MKGSMFDDKRVVLGGGVLAVVLVVALAWFLGVSPRLSSAEDLGVQTEDAQMQNVKLTRENTKLAEQQARIGEVEATLAAAQASLPDKTAFPAFTRDLQRLAEVAKVDLTTIQISDPEPVAADPAAAQGDTATEPPADGANPAAPAEPASTQRKVKISLTSSGTLRQQTAFLKSVQDGARRALVDGAQVSVDGGSQVSSVDGDTTLITQLTIFTAS